MTQSTLMRCLYCGILQDEPAGAKVCLRCGGELVAQAPPPADERASYLEVQMELDQVQAPAGQNVERYLLVTLHTPSQIPPEQAARTRTGRPPLAFTAVLDISGSMAGEKLSHAKQALRSALDRLQDGDSLALVTFHSEVSSVLQPTPVNAEARRLVESALQEINAGGMTALCGGLELGLEKAYQTQQDTNLVLLLSDGQANVGETDLEKVGYHALQARQKGVTVSALGVGADYNEALMAEIANQGGGRFYHVMNSSEISAYLTGEVGEMASLACRQATLEIDLPPGAVLAALSSVYSINQQAGHAQVVVGDLPSGLEMEIPLRVILPSHPLGSKLSFTGSVVYTSPAGNSLKSSLNRVTLRFVEQAGFQLQDGAVQPVAKRVLDHLRAASVLGYSRAMSKDPRQAQRQVSEQIDRVRSYATLLGEEIAEREAGDLRQELNDMAAPAFAKASVSMSFQKSRPTKKFGGNG